MTSTQHMNTRIQATIGAASAVRRRIGFAGPHPWARSLLSVCNVGLFRRE